MNSSSTSLNILNLSSSSSSERKKIDNISRLDNGWMERKNVFFYARPTFKILQDESE